MPRSIRFVNFICSNCVLTDCTYLLYICIFVSVYVSHVSCFDVLISDMINANNWHLTNTNFLSFIFSSGARSYARAHFGQGKDKTWLDDLECLGDEYGLEQCMIFKDWGQENCGHSDDVGVSCQGIIVYTNINQ